VGKLVKVKNPVLLINGLREINDLEVRATMLGDGNLLELLTNNSKGLNVEFAGKVKNVYHYLRRSKILVLTSISEGFPNVILEGMSYGLPIIATNCQSGPLELLNENLEVTIPINEFVKVKYGILINNNDEVALAKAMYALLSSQELYNEMKKASFSRSKDYSVSKIYNDFKQLIEE